MQRMKRKRWEKVKDKEKADKNAIRGKTTIQFFWFLDAKKKKNHSKNVEHRHTSTAPLYI